MGLQQSGTAILLAELLFWGMQATVFPEILETKLENPQEGYQNASVGSEISIDGNLMILGAFSTDALDLSFAGEAFIYRRLPEGRWEKEADLIASDAARNAYFGSAVAVSGDTALVGAPRDSERAAQAGAAYVYTHDGEAWVEEAKLTGSSAPRDGLFGQAVLLHGDMAIIAAPQYGYSGYLYGAVYIFKRTDGTWSEHQRLLPPDPVHRGYFGDSLAMTDSSLLVGTAKVGSAPDGQGAIYVYTLGESGLWEDPTFIFPAQSESEEFTGSPIAISGESIIATVSNSTTDCAKVFVRSENEWQQQGTLSMGGLAADDQFGHDVAIQNDTAFVSILNFGSQQPVGAISVFQRTGDSWLQTSTVTAPENLGGIHFGYSLCVNQQFIATGATSAVCLYPFTSSFPSDPEDIIRVGEGASGDDFGQSVSIWGNTAVVGAGQDGQLGWGTGSASVFTWEPDGWTHSTTLFAPDPALWDSFGTGVAVFQDTVLCSARHFQDPEDKPGSVYVFTREEDAGWTYRQKLKTSDEVPRQGYGFGESIAIWEQTILVGDPFDTDIGVRAGAVFVFELDESGEWQDGIKLLPNGISSEDYFGYSVALHGNTAVVGAPYDSDSAALSGAAYVFERSPMGIWEKVTKLKADTPEGRQGFGRAVAIDGHTIVVGAPGVSSEAAFVYKRTEDGQWRFQAKLQSDAPSTQQSFGHSVAVRGRTIAIGGEGSVYLGPPDRIYLFTEDETGDWTQQHAITPADHELGDRFGTTLALHRGRVLVGASDNAGPEVDSGAAYLYELD